MTIVTSLPAAAREGDERGWLRSRRSFPSKALTLGGRARFPLFVIAEDIVAAGQGFGRHPHSDMEILSYVIAGALEHGDSTGQRVVLRPGEIQLMTAGSGIEHSEYNASATEPVHFLQIWIKPDANGLPPAYAHTAFDASLPVVKLAGLGDAPVKINQAMTVWRAAPAPGETVSIALEPNETAWVHSVRGRSTVAGRVVNAGDGLAVTEAPRVVIAGGDAPSELLIFVAKLPAINHT